MNRPSSRSRLRRSLTDSRISPVLAAGSRVRDVARYDAAVIRESARWLWQSRETTNFTYNLTSLNMEYLNWWVSAVTGTEVSKVRCTVQELVQDTDLHGYVARTVQMSQRAYRSDSSARFGRRAAWYALVRLTQPDVVVETGTDQGLGSLALATALQRNGRGRLVTIDSNPASGHLLRHFDGPVERIIGSSIDVIPELGPADVGLFIHDSLHSYAYEQMEFQLITPLLTSTAIVLSDNAHNSSALADWAEQTQRSFLYFQEQPAQHWYPGGGVGAAWALPGG